MIPTRSSTREIARRFPAESRGSKGDPAIVASSQGKGKTVLIGTYPSAAFEQDPDKMRATGELLQRLVASAAIPARSRESPTGLRARRGWWPPRPRRARRWYPGDPRWPWVTLPTFRARSAHGARRCRGNSTTLRLRALWGHESIDLLQRPRDFVCSSSVVRLRESRERGCDLSQDSSWKKGSATVQFIDDGTKFGFDRGLWVGIAESLEGEGCTS